MSLHTFILSCEPPDVILPSFPTRRSSDLLWLLDAPYSLLHQSRFNADGTGLGWIDERGQARLRKRDRKSTRLNSSHVAISYAVFCLKKKKGMHRIDQLLLELAEAGDQAGR